MFLFGRKVARLAPPAVLSDKVVPVAYWDHHFRDAVLNVMLRFDHKLDASKLRGSLEKLLDRRDGWRRLGGRLRMDSRGKLNWHVPAKYTAQRPAIAYHHKQHNEISITQHPLASRLRGRGKKSTSSIAPSSSSLVTSDAVHDRGPWMVAPGGGVDFSPLMRQPDDPTCFEDYLYQDIPMIGLQVTTFNDATLVSLNFSHIMWDAMGLKDFLDAWSLTLQGRDDEVIPLIENDPLALLGCSHELREFVPRDKVETSATPPYMPEQYKHANNQLDVIQLLRLGLRQVLDKMTHKNLREEFRTICVPATYIDALRKEALQALQIDYSNMPSVIASENDQERRLGPLSTFLSDGDILCAWWTRHIIASRIRNATKSHKTVAVLNMMGLRGILAQAGLLPDSGALVGNAIAPVPALLRAQDLMAGGPLGLGRVARALRLAITQLGTRPQVEALLSLQRRAYGSHDDNHINDKNKKKKRGKGKSGLPALFGDAGMHMVVCTNWTKAAFFDVDFSAAVVDEIGCDGLWEDERIARSGLPSVNVRARPRLEDSVIGCDGLWEEEHVLREKVPLSGATHLAARVVAKPSGIHMHLITAGTPAFLMSIFTILGRDASGSYWIQGMLRKEYWSQIEKALGH